ncbi:hypothetical protein LAZ67_X002476 [Cordylochernes scorpioides]|uniref:Reverse transcriptase domain-containing protein n=1 Tax=Cordylochernes scorpioides TaxID=51811 RepID=A0ABY6LWM7_9ARAC|nr:hypothetical protein LAZ67_X002476 [Cordylochernes scorpioides]
MVSFDVTSLYLSLPHSLIADKLQSFLVANNIDTQTASHILQLASLCLSVCTFTFNKQFYKQTRGTPMGSPLSSIISEIVMGSLDAWINQALPSDIYYWRRYVDDIFCIIKTDSLQLTYSTLHDFNPHIKFTYETEIGSVLPFLDILIIRTPQSFHTSVFHKKHIPPQYTHFSSNSPISFKINTVRTLTKRIVTHCSLPIFKTIERSRIHSLLTTAGYPIDFIVKHTFDPRVQRTTTIHRATCWLPFSPAAVSISRVLRPYGIKVLYNSPPSLATILRHHITKSDKPTLPINSTGAVYSIQCLDCPTSYVGETGRTTGIRISEHRRNIRNKDPKSLIFTHIAQTGHSFDLDHPQRRWASYSRSIAVTHLTQAISRINALGRNRYENFVYQIEEILEVENVSQLVKLEQSAISNVKLPKFNLPIFSGEMSQWLSFKDLFLVTIDKNTTLSDIQKLQYLHSSLKGDAARIIKGFPITENNYNQAWKTLIERYDNKREIIFSQLDKIFKIKLYKISASKAMYELLDICNESLRNLETIGLERN